MFIEPLLHLLLNLITKGIILQRFLLNLITKVMCSTRWATQGPWSKLMSLVVRVIRTIKNYHTRRHFACLLCVVSVVQFCFPFAHNTLNVRYWYWWQWSEPVSRRSTSMTRRGWRAWRNCLKEVDSLPSTYSYACYRTLILSGWCVLCLWICGLL
jgi:hypothetical protein